MSSRSLNVSGEQLERVKKALKRQGFRSQQALVEEFAGSPSKSTINNFFTGKDIDRQYFIDICEKLELDWQSVAEIADEEATLYVKRSPVEAKCVESVELLGCLIRIKAPERREKLL